MRSVFDWPDAFSILWVASRPLPLCLRALAGPILSLPRATGWSCARLLAWRRTKPEAVSGATSPSGGTGVPVSGHGARAWWMKSLDVMPLGLGPRRSLRAGAGDATRGWDWILRCDGPRSNIDAGKTDKKNTGGGLSGAKIPLAAPRSGRAGLHVGGIWSRRWDGWLFWAGTRLADYDALTACVCAKCRQLLIRPCFDAQTMGQPRVRSGLREVSRAAR